MKAKMKSGKVISGRLAETFTKIGIAKEVKRGRKPNEIKEADELEVKEKKPKKQKDEKVS